MCFYVEITISSIQNLHVRINALMNNFILLSNIYYLLKWNVIKLKIYIDNDYFEFNFINLIGWN